MRRRLNESIFSLQLKSLNESIIILQLESLNESIFILQLKSVGTISHRHFAAGALLVVADAGQGQAPLLSRPLQVVERAEVLVRSLAGHPGQGSVGGRTLNDRRTDGAFRGREGVGTRPESKKNEKCFSLVFCSTNICISFSPSIT